MKKLSLLLLALCSLTLPSCVTLGDNDNLTSIYDKDGNELAKVGEKNLASVRVNGNVPLVRLTKDGWAAVGDKLLEGGAIVGKGIVSSYLDRYISPGYVNVSK